MLIPITVKIKSPAIFTTQYIIPCPNASPTIMSRNDDANDSSINKNTSRIAVPLCSFIAALANALISCLEIVPFSSKAVFVDLITFPQFEQENSLL